MKLGVPDVQAQYGKAIFQQQQFVRTHERTILHNISTIDMALIQPNLQAVPGVQALHKTF